MRRRFHMEKIGDPKEFFDVIKGKLIFCNDPVLETYNNYAIMFEDLRTIIELNKTMEDLIVKKYVFFKMPLSKRGLRKYFNEEDQAVDMETYNILLLQSLFTTIIITYAKCFSKTIGKGKLKIERKDVFKDKSSSLLKIHESVIKYRNELFAHNAATFWESTYTMYIQSEWRGESEHLFSFPQKKRMPALKEIKSFHKVFMAAIEHVHSKMEILKPKVVEVIKTNQTS